MKHFFNKLPISFPAVALLLLATATSCFDDDVEVPVINTGNNAILSFSIQGLESVQPIITDTEVIFEIDFNKEGKDLNVAQLSTIVTHSGASVNTPRGTPQTVTDPIATITQNFTGRTIPYIVIAETGQARTYQVSVKSKPGTAFVTTWNAATITVPTNSKFTYNYNIDTNGDGFIDQAGITGDANVTFTGVERTVYISGRFPAISLGFTSEDDKITDIAQWGTVEWRSMEFAFLGCENLQVSAADTPDLSAVGSMLNMFRGATNANPDVRNWDTSNITTMESMFLGATSANPDVSRWNISRIQASNLGLFSVFNNSGISRENYEKALIRFAEHATDPNSEGLSLPRNIDLGSVPVPFCSPEAAQAKATLEANGWRGMGDRGTDCDV